MMLKSLTFASAFLVVSTAPGASAQATSINVQYDTKYDNSSESIDSVSCSDGPNGLGTKGYNTLGAVPNFPLIAGAPNVSWDSPNCGACYAITYGSTTIYVTAVDAATNSFVLSEEAMNKLTDNQAVALGHVTASYATANASECAAAPSS